MDLQTQLADIMESRGISQSSISRSLDISTSTLSQWLRGQYKGNITEVDTKVRKFLQREAEKVRTPKSKIPFQMTTVAKRVFEVARICHLDGEVGVVIGDAGLGKTAAVREYARREPGAILIEADLGYTAKALFQELCKKLGVEAGKQLHTLLDAAVDKLRDSGRILIIDEAEHLPYKALELLRRLYDHTNIGLLLTGMPRLYGNIKGRRVDFAQLYSRVGVYTDLKKLTDGDVEKIVTSVHPHANGLCKVYAKNAHGNARRLTKLIARSERVAQVNQTKITKDVIERATEMLIS